MFLQLKMRTVLFATCQCRRADALYRWNVEIKLRSKPNLIMEQCNFIILVLALTCYSSDSWLSMGSKRSAALTMNGSILHSLISGFSLHWRSLSLTFALVIVTNARGLVQQKANLLATILKQLRVKLRGPLPLLQSVKPMEECHYLQVMLQEVLNSYFEVCCSKHRGDHS